MRFYCSLVAQVTLPDHQRFPACRSKSFKVFLISEAVTRNLFEPVPAVGLRYPRTADAAVPVPKTTMNKNDFLEFWKNQIRFPGEIDSMQPETITHPMSQATNGKLRRRVAALHGAHCPTAQLRPFFLHHRNSVLKEAKTTTSAAQIAGHGTLGWARIFPFQRSS